MLKKKSFIAEFKEFISRGNVTDMAIGVIIGSAFTAIVTSLVNDVITPIIAKLIGGISFSEYKIVLTPGTEEIAETAILYGVFLEKVFNFLIVALVIFSVIKLINRLRRKQEEAPAEPEPEPAPDPSVVLLEEIRDLLKDEKAK